MSSDRTTGKKTRSAGIFAPVGIFCAICLLCVAAVFSGCVSASASQSVQDWNAWSALQQKFSYDVAGTLTTMDGHQTALNAEIQSGKPDFSGLRGNIAADKESLDRWKLQLMALDSSANRFFANATLLNGTAYETAQRMNANIGAYLQNINAARTELTAYCTHLDLYLSEGDFTYADDSQRVAADAARERALLDLKHADDALAALDADVKALERAQTVI